MTWTSGTTATRTCARWVLVPGQGVLSRAQAPGSQGLVWELHSAPLPNTAPKGGGLGLASGRGTLLPTPAPRAGLPGRGHAYHEVFSGSRRAMRGPWSLGRWVLGCVTGSSPMPS